MDPLIVILLSVVQGLGEFIPISSSGHLTIISYFLDSSLTTKEISAFIVFLHLGTLIALLIYQRKIIFKILKSLPDDLKTKKNFTDSLFLKIIIASLPALVFGFLYSKFIQEDLSRTDSFLIACIALMLAGLTFILTSNYIKGKNNKKMSELNLKRSFFIGIFQSLPVVSGFSRSGMTITGARLNNLSNKDSIEFSFLIGIPIILAATAYSLLESYEFLFSYENIAINLLGMVISGVVGYFAISFLFKYLRTRGLQIFGYYCLCFGLISLLIYIF